VIELYLREHFRKESPGVLARWLGNPGADSYVIRSVIEHQAAQYFPGIALLRVELDDDILQTKLRGGGSVGIFAIREGAVGLLTAEHPEALFHLLSDEDRLEDAPAAAIASLCCETLLAQQSHQSEVVTSVREIREWYPEARGYEILQDDARLLEERLHVPRWQIHDSGKNLEFWVLTSHFPNYQVWHVVVEIPRDGDAGYKKQVVVERVFARTPVVRR
jgi:hypothetical protein